MSKPDCSFTHIFLLSFFTLPLMAANKTVKQVNHDLEIELINVIEVVDKKIVTNNEVEISSDSALTKPLYDTGEMFRSVTGMTALRRGGRGFEPVIRGQSQRRINVITDGAFQFSAGPGRMDPPTTYISLDSFDRVTVIKGNRSVIYGAGGSGGTIRFEHQRPIFYDNHYQGKLSTGYISNSEMITNAADIAMGTETGYLRVFASNKSSGNYDDGRGQTVASAFKSDSWGLISGLDLTPNQYMEFSLEASNNGESLYPGNGMDAVFADSKSFKAKWQYEFDAGIIDYLKINIFRGDVDHLMNNYSVRNRNIMPNGMATLTSSDTWGGKLISKISLSQSDITFGIDFLANNKNAILYQDLGKDGTLDNVTSLLWPEVEQRLFGGFIQWNYTLNYFSQLRTGLRLDKFKSKASTATTITGMMGNATPVNLYQNFYGFANLGIPSTESTNPGLVLGLDNQLSSSLQLSTNLSLSSRNPDPTELYLARNMMGNFWVGNPELKTERHQQIELTLFSQEESTNWSVSIFWDEIKNYIDRYSLASATLYRNINAHIKGFEFDLSKRISDNLSSSLGLSYSRGIGDKGNLGQISPLQTQLNLDYQLQNWSLGTEIILASRQKHFNPDVDVAQETPGFVLLNIYSQWTLNKNFHAEAGIANLLEKNYAYHVNSANLDPFSPDAVRVNEPGRQLWIKLFLTF